MEIKWRKVSDELPECTDWDIDREAFYSDKVLTYSKLHGIQPSYGRMDDKYADGMIRPIGVKQKGRSFKWGIGGDDKGVTHWVYCKEIAPE